MGEPFMKKCVDLTRTEAGCMYYGWTIQGDKLFCREAYVDAKAVQAHLENIGAAVGEMLDRAPRRWTRSSSTARRRAGRRSRRPPTGSAASTGTATPASPSSRCELRATMRVLSR